MTATAVTEVIAAALPYAFVIGSGLFVARFLPPELRRSGWTVAVIILAVGIGAFWSYVAFGWFTFGRQVSLGEAAPGIAFVVLLAVAAALDVWAFLGRSAIDAVGRMVAVILATVIAAFTPPGILWITYSIDSAGERADAIAAEANLDRQIAERSAPLSLVVHDAVVTLDGPVPTYGPGAQGVDGTIHLRADLVSTSAISVDAGSPFISVEVTRPDGGQDPGEFSLDLPPLPAVIPVGTTPLDLTLDGGAVAGGEIESANRVWTLRLHFNYTGPGTGFEVTSTFQPTFVP